MVTYVIYEKNDIIFAGDNMVNKDLKKIVIESYMEYLKNELLEDSNENVEQYVSTLYYDILDDIVLNKELFGIEQEISDTEAVNLIEQYIEKILKEK